MPGRAKPVAHFQGIGCVGRLAHVARQPEARLHDIELFQQQQIRPRPFAQPCSSFGAHAQTAAKSPGTLARAAGQGRKPAGGWPEQGYDQVRLAIGYGSQDNGRRHEPGSHEFKLPRPAAARPTSESGRQLGNVGRFEETQALARLRLLTEE